HAAVAPACCLRAEDGIRDRNVTGVQTCALPISPPGSAPAAPPVSVSCTCSRPGPRSSRRTNPRPGALPAPSREASTEMRVLCSTGAFSRHPDRCEPSTVAEGIRALGADGIEAIFYTPWYDAIDTAARE